ncbi:MAG: MarR family transcriptional regulator [Pacificimonas sp.]
MTDQNMSSDSVPVASPLFLREDEVRRGIELVYFGHADLLKEADETLRSSHLGRAHHRALYFIARRPGLSMGELVGLLSVTKQALSRVIGDLTARELIRVEPGQRDRRQRLITLTDEGLRLEHELFELLRQRMARAYAEAGQDAVTGFWRVLAELLPDDRRAEILAL